MECFVVKNFATSYGMESNDLIFSFWTLDWTPLFWNDSKCIIYLIKIKRDF